MFPTMLFLSVPLWTFLFYQYVGVPGAQIQRCGYDMVKLRLPFCGPLNLLILGSYSIAMHDYHHKTFHGNFAPSCSYLDKKRLLSRPSFRRSPNLNIAMMQVAHCGNWVSADVDSKNDGRIDGNLSPLWRPRSGDLAQVAGLRDELYLDFLKKVYYAILSADAVPPSPTLRVMTVAIGSSG